VKLLYFTLGLGVLRDITDATNECWKIPFIPAMLIIFALIGINWYMFHMIGKGKNWARVTFLALFIIGVPFQVFSFQYSLNMFATLSVLLRIGHMVIQVVAIALLFQKPSNAWFSEMGVKK
jgi:hypothetical protein